MVIFYEEKPVFFDRADAGRKLAEKLANYNGQSIMVFAIPNGGVPVAIEVAKSLDAPLDIILPRKLPVPENPEAGFGAVTEDGVIVLNEPLVKQLGLPRPLIERQAQKVRAEITRRIGLYRSKLKAPPVLGKTAIIIDDGLASGYTMLAAIKSVQLRGAARTIVASPVASGSAFDLLRPLVEDMVCLIVARMNVFAVASFYYSWHDLTEHEVFKLLADWKARQQAGKPKETEPT